uniref:BHLH domain-containing protein n=1 Tax=Meloidogyne floridensis TaxID=298350 RepID=A0A915P8Z5_9BILA
MQQQQPNGTSIPNNFQQTINSLTYPQLQQQQPIYFETTNSTTNNSDNFYSMQLQPYQTQQIQTGELLETKQQKSSSEQFNVNNENIIKKKGPGPGRPPKIKIDNNKREDVAGCSNMYEYNTSILKSDQMQMLSLDAKSTNNIMVGGTTTQPTLSSVQFPYGDPTACFGVQSSFDISAMPPDYNNLGVTWAGHPSSYNLTSAPTPAICGGFGDIDGLYGNTSGLIALPGQLQYELDPMLANGYGVWPTANGYYLGNDPGKLLTTTDGSLQSTQQPPPQQYLGAASTSNNYTGGDNVQSTATTFYGAPPPLQPPSSIDPTSVFHTGISTLPPPPSLLASADQLYGLQNGPNGVFGSLTSFDPLPPSNNLLSVSNTNTETSNTPTTLLNLEQCSSSNGNQFTIRQPEQQQQLLFVGTPNGQIIEEKSNTNSVLTSTTIPTTLSLISSPPIGGTISSKTSMGKKHKTKKNLQNSNILLSRPSTSLGGGGGGGGMLSSTTPFHPKLGSESPFKEKLKQRDTSSSNGRKSRSRSLLKDSDDDKSAEEREVERRNANNTRERIRVRDINAAFKELARLCCSHMPNLEERNLTKLNTLLKAVELIPMLEKMTRMMDPRGDCVKRRMETTTTIPDSTSSSSLLLNPSSNGILNSNLFNTCGSDLSSLASSSNILNQQHF